MGGFQLVKQFFKYTIECLSKQNLISGSLKKFSEKNKIKNLMKLDKFLTNKNFVDEKINKVNEKNKNGNKLKKKK